MRGSKECKTPGKLAAQLTVKRGTILWATTLRNLPRCLHLVLIIDDKNPHRLFLLHRRSTVGICNATFIEPRLLCVMYHHGAESIRALQDVCPETMLLFNQSVFDFYSVKFFQHRFGCNQQEDYRCCSVDKVHGQARHIVG